MPPRFIVAAVLAALIAFPSGAARAEGVDRVVKRNRTTAVNAMYGYNKAICDGAANATARIRRQPKHGKVVIRTSRRKLPKDAKICRGMIVTGPVVRYTPDRGYTGTDTLVVDYQTDACLFTARLIVRSFEVNITVK